MSGVFPSQEWLDALIEHLNTDEKYAKTARKWEGDIVYEVQADATFKEGMKIYMDLWHGKCRGGELLDAGEEREAAFVLSAPYGVLLRILQGDLDPMQAMMTRKLVVKGSMAYMMRNVPTVLEFVRCCRDVTDQVVGD